MVLNVRSNLHFSAKVSNAASTSSSGLQWFKIAQDGLDTSTGLWGVDRMISGGGWHYFTLPSCVAPGQYLLRGEIIGETPFHLHLNLHPTYFSFTTALHSAYTQGQAQFYTSCAQISVTGSGTFTGSGFLSFPGAYSATDPGILLNIYSGSSPNNGGKAYTPPGGAVQTCTGGGTSPTTTSKPAGATTTSKAATTTSASSGSGAPLYGQCGAYLA